jgi:hypothetical protein
MGLRIVGTFKAAEAHSTFVEEVDTGKLGRRLAEARDVHWDDKKLVRRKGRLGRME